MDFSEAFHIYNQTYFYLSAKQPWPTGFINNAMDITLAVAMAEATRAANTNSEPKDFQNFCDFMNERLTSKK